MVLATDNLDGFRIEIFFSLPVWFRVLAILFLCAQSLSYALLMKITQDFEREKITHKENLLNLATQVAHDIRSPLAALKILNKSLVSLPHHHRAILGGAITRTQGIATHSLTHNPPHTDLRSSSQAVSSQDLGSFKIATVVTSLVKEKLLQFRDRSGLKLFLNISAGAEMLNAKGNELEFSRVLSNLINNSAESISNDGEISISLYALGNKKIIVEIKDTGQGIPAHILPRLGQKGASFGKNSSSIAGTGLGLFHARTTLESWDGLLEIDSTEGLGTLVKLTLNGE